MFKLLIFVVTLIFLAIGIILGVLNPELVELDVFVVKTMIPLGLALALALVVGALLGLIIVMIQTGRLKWQLRKQVKMNQKRLNEIVQLKKKIISEQEILTNPSNTLVRLEK